MLLRDVGRVVFLGQAVLRGSLLLVVACGVLMGVALAVAPLMPPAPQVAFMGNRDFNWDIYLLDVRSGIIVPITQTRVTAERYPAWSPDGKRIAYHANPHGDYDLFLMNADGRDQRLLGVSSELNQYIEAMAAWSPDGQYIGYHSGVEGLGFDLYVGEPERTNATSVTTGNLDYLHLDWSPDGTRIAFSEQGRQRSPTRQIAIMEVVNEDGTLRADPTTKRVLTTGGYFPAWSPDGDQIAYVTRQTGQASIRLYDLETDEDRALTPPTGNGEATHPEWLPDGATLMFASDRAGTYDIYTLNVANGDVRRMTYERYDVLAPDWRPR